MNPFYSIIFILLLLLNEYIYAQFVLPPTNLNEYDAYGSLLTINEYLAIIAQNDQEQFTIITYPFTNHSEKCLLPYDTIKRNVSSLTRFVYNVVIGAKQNASQLMFSYIDENWRRDVFLTIVFLKITNTGCVQAIDCIAINITDFKMQEHALVGMDPYGKRAYAVGTYYIICIEIETGMHWQLDMEGLFNNQSSFGDFFFPKALGVTEDHYIFTVGQRFRNLRFLPYLFVLNFKSLDNVTLFSTTQLSEFNFGPSAIDITRDSTMSISVLDEVEWFLIGIPRLDMFLILSWNSTNVNKEPVIVRKHISSKRGVLFGKSVALLDNNTFAVLAHALPTLPWSTSQVQVYSIDGEQSNNRPIAIYPNNQQIIPSVNSEPPPHSILTIVSWRSHLGLVLDVGAALIVSASLPGYYSAQTDDNLIDMSIYISVPCIPGTARNTTSFGPCFLCPPQTKNNGTSGNECESCATNDTFLCLRGSLTEIPLLNVTEYNQAVPYPNSPDLVQYDDILLQNIFSFMTTSPRCLVISPLFWALIAVGLGLIIFIVMCILICFPQWHPQRTFLKKLFKHMDLVGEGEMWFGGLMTFAIVVLLIFTCKFTVSFARLYPIETVLSNSETTSACDLIFPNAKFSSNLQLLSIAQHEDENLTFTMLDKQNITLTIHFVGTGFSCHDLMMQENLVRGQRIPSTDFNCSYDKKVNILSVSTLLPQHLITMQFDLVGPYFIGGLRVCLAGPSSVDQDEKYTLQELQFCQFVYTDNETLTIYPTINFKMTKVVNRTIGYTVNDDISLSGIWIPTLTMDTLSDALLISKNGEYIRYLSDRVTLIVDISESEFFVKNTQEPIARHTEIVLHTVLFSMVFLDLFGLLFLIVKLTIFPFAERIRRRFFSKKTQSLESNEKHVQLTGFVEFPDGQGLKMRKITTRHIENDNEIISIETVL